jgi:hypothetical protein
MGSEVQIPSPNGLVLLKVGKEIEEAWGVCEGRVNVVAVSRDGLSLMVDVEIGRS